MLQEEGTIVKTDNGYNLTVNGELMFVKDYRRLKDLLMDLARNINESYEVRKLNNILEAIDIQNKDGMQFAKIDVARLYTDFSMQQKGTFTLDELKSFKDFLQLKGDETKAELRALRNTIVKYYADNSNGLSDEDYDIFQDKMSAFTGMIDYMMMSLNEAFTLTDEADEETQLGDFYFADDFSDLEQGLDKITLADSIGLRFTNRDKEQIELTVHFNDEDDYTLIVDNVSKNTKNVFEPLTQKQLLDKIQELKQSMQPYGPYIIYSKAPEQKKFKAMDMNNGVQVSNLIYATLIYEPEDKLVGYVDDLNEMNPGWSFEFRKS